MHQAHRDRRSLFPRLMKFIVSLSSGKGVDAFQTNPQEVMLELVQKYSHFVYPPKMHTSGTNGDTTDATSESGTYDTSLHADPAYSPSLSSYHQVVLAGATGSLGSYILNGLLADSDVKTIYCLCHAKIDTGATARIAASVKACRLLVRFCGAHIIANERVAAPAEWLGLEGKRYREIANRVTVIIHVRTRFFTSLYLASHRLERMGSKLQLRHIQVRTRSGTIA